MSWVKWDDVILSYGFGGLNIGSLKGKNLALIGKWWWRFKNEPNSFWAKIVTSIHGSGGLLNASDSLRTQGKGGVWVNIVRVGREIEKIVTCFRDSFIRKIGDGSSTKFWDDTWLMDTPLKVKYSRLFHLEQEKSVAVKDRVEWGDQGCIINWKWERNPSGRVQDEMADLINRLVAYTKSNKQQDSWHWKLSSNGLFNTKVLSNFLEESTLDLITLQVQEETIRNRFVPLKVEVFMWRLLRRRLPVHVELDKRGIDLNSVL
ncbi:uncharacterized protein [Rutidosis leptorrhynchoides]|uniref:uncharacterized protein n=1 Tax=Rutidosis leptorrhynchoides TaxID=125765 RepID=UPI003A9A3E40